ncbi:hypothetical protein TNCV_1667071 [Trichonephila clavipes]|nr:hypothetical protein TNCV_1667071 [Trichonephila clavipes]
MSKDMVTVIFTSPYTAIGELMEMDDIILNLDQVTKTTPELKIPSPNYHTTPTCINPYHSEWHQNSNLQRTGYKSVTVTTVALVYRGHPRLCCCLNVEHQGSLNIPGQEASVHKIMKSNRIFERKNTPIKV